ncbi:hyaluronan-binding protein 2-like [Plectropomus leopardus]|uniref:hyaluronan-binding protein 2-like n=1 Tax=Plectropomus leopardus TaxID=160734 RepID=UPI001C4AA506|nr:hyaluronan-binding protein 2-like [Plectropomus leopardus]
MLTAGALLISLSILCVHGNDPHLDAIYIDYEDDYPTEAPGFFFDTGDWLFDLIDENNACDPDPCFNGGECQVKSDTNFTCICPEPYIGKRCQRVKDVCENVRCGHGECVTNLNKAPYYECKCKPPYQGPDCKTVFTCEPSPCQNGGSCTKANRRLRCLCPDGFTGKFCEIASTDCFEGNGASYRGVVSTTENGQECLNWHSSFIVNNGDDPFNMYSDFTGLERNNHCRNPDGDDKPWCYTKSQGQLSWAYCKVKKCDEVPATPPTPVIPDSGSVPFSQCGISQPFRNSRIFGGRKSSPGAHPWQVSVQIRPTGAPFDFRHYCGGILITSCWVLTAAHCIEPNNDYQVVMGGVDILKQEESDQTIPVIQTIVHEDYRDTPTALHNDIALLKLQVTDSPYCANETRFVKTVCLPDQAFPAGKECVISGWGATETERYSSQLLNARVFLISEQRCKNTVYGSVLDDSMICAGTLQGGIDSCQGDSGGPLVCEQNDKHYITGVVSWGYGCAERNKPGIYANVSQFTNWITSKIN